MASNSADIGTGLTMAMGGTQEFEDLVLTNVDWGGISRVAIETTSLGATAAAADTFGNKTFIPGDTVDPGELSVEGYHNPDKDLPIGLAAQTITITYRGPDDVAGATWVGSGFCTSYDVSVPFDDSMKFTAVFKMSGAITINPDA